MRNRKVQMALHRAKIYKEERILLRNKYGIKDPTPYDAVKNMVNRQKQAQAC